MAKGSFHPERGNGRLIQGGPRISGRSLLIILATCSMLLAQFGKNLGTTHATVVDRVVAIVNQEIITLSELKLATAQLENPLLGELLIEPPRPIEEQTLHETLKILIEKKLQLQAAHQRGITVGEGELQQALAEIKNKKGISNDTNFLTVLSQANLTLDDFTQEIKDQITILKLINREIHSSVILQEQEINAYYHSHPGLFQIPERIHLAQVLLSLPNSAGVHEAKELERQAAEIRAQLVKGADFSSIARKYSVGPEASLGGDLGIFRKGELMEEIESKVFALRTGEISPVVRSPLGLHIFKILERQDEESVPYEQAKYQVQEKLFLERTDMAYKLWLKRLRDQSYVEVRM